MKSKSKSNFSILIFEIVLLTFIQLLSSSLNAQCWKWAIASGGITAEFPMAISVGPNGISAITGNFQGTAIFGMDTLTSISGYDVFTVIVDSSGMILNAMGGFGNGSGNIGSGIATDKNGNIYVTGNFKDAIDFENITLVSEGLEDLFIVKYDPSGTLLWATSVGGSNNIYVHDIAVDQLGNCIITGEFYNTANFGTHEIHSTGALDVFTAKYDPDGNTLWVKTCGSYNSDLSNGVAVDGQGNIYITGIFQSEFIFNNKGFTSTGNRDGFVAKYDASGNPLWAQAGGGIYNEYFNKIAADKDGNSIYVTGEFESPNIDFAGIKLVNTNTELSRRDPFLLKFNGSLEAQWGTSTGSKEHDYSNDIAMDDNGDIYITGTFRNSIVFGNTNLTSNGYDSYVTKYSSSGTVIWAQKPTYNSASAQSISLAIFKNNPIITGSFAAGAAPPIVVFDQDTLVSNGSLDLFVARLDALCDVATGILNPEMSLLDLKVFPNPFADVLNIVNSNQLVGDVKISLFDSWGRLILIESRNTQKNIALPTEHLPPGIYILNVCINGESHAIKTVKHKQHY